jgi:hypothetical protein
MVNHFLSIADQERPDVGRRCALHRSRLFND